MPGNFSSYGGNLGAVAAASNARLKSKGRPMGTLSFGDVGNLATPSENILPSRRYAPPSSISPRGSSNAGPSRGSNAPARNIPQRKYNKPPGPGFRGGFGLGASRLDQMREASRE